MEDLAYAALSLAKQRSGVRVHTRGHKNVVSDYHSYCLYHKYHGTHTVIPGMTLGATYLGGRRCPFRFRATLEETVEVRIVAPRERVAPMAWMERGHHSVTSHEVDPGDLWYLQAGRADRASGPASRYQPRGVHGLSLTAREVEVVRQEQGLAERNPICL